MHLVLRRRSRRRSHEPLGQATQARPQQCPPPFRQPCASRHAVAYPRNADPANTVWMPKEGSCAQRWSNPSALLNVRIAKGLVRHRQTVGQRLKRATPNTPQMPARYLQEKRPLAARYPRSNCLCNFDGNIPRQPPSHGPTLQGHRGDYRISTRGSPYTE